MANGLEKVGIIAADLMERLEDDYKDFDDVEIGIVAVVVEVNYVDRQDDGVSAVEYRCSDERRWIQHGLFEAARRAVTDSSEEADGP